MKYMWEHFFAIRNVYGPIVSISLVFWYISLWNHLPYQLNSWGPEEKYFWSRLSSNPGYKREDQRNYLTFLLRYDNVENGSEKGNIRKKASFLFSLPRNFGSQDFSPLCHRWHITSSAISLKCFLNELFPIIILSCLLFLDQGRLHTSLTLTKLYISFFLIVGPCPLFSQSIFFRKFIELTHEQCRG